MIYVLGLFRSNFFLGAGSDEPDDDHQRADVLVTLVHPEFSFPVSNGSVGVGVGVGVGGDNFAAVVTLDLDFKTTFGFFQ